MFVTWLNGESLSEAGQLSVEEAAAWSREGWGALIHLHPNAISIQILPHQA